MRLITKGLKAHQHEIALLRMEVQDLRDANHILSRRRREKKTRLRNKGTITVKEGQASID
jgi:FtsZ-binding cell division protein ZapB